MTAHPMIRYGALLAATAALAACRAPPPKETEAQQARAVTVVRVQQRGLTGGLSASGVLIPREEAAVAPEVTGYRVARVLVEEGQYVERGQTLVELDPSLLRAQVEQQAALAAQAQAQAELAESEAARVKGLDGEGVLADEQIQSRRFQARAARATAEAQAAGLRDLRTRQGKLAVSAPVSGLVLARNVRPGDLAAGAGDPWFRIARDGEIELAAELPESDLARLRPGQTATVTLPSQAQVAGRVRLVSPEINNQTKLGVARIQLPNRSDIRSGGFARASFASTAGSALSVPASAVRYDADGASVMVVGADNRVRRVAVQTGAQGDGFVALLKGPPANSRVVGQAAALLLDGDLVRPVEAAAPAAAK